jgi:hypothetical protein
MAAVRDRIEALSFQEVLQAEDAKMKLRFADRFPLHLPDSTEDVPGHMFHRIRLKDPNKVNNGKGYTAPKKYQESWKRLLDDHLKAILLRIHLTGVLHPKIHRRSTRLNCRPNKI